MTDQDNGDDSKGAEWIGIGLTFGAGLGVAFGVFTDSLSIGIPIGAGLGIVFGALIMAVRQNEDSNNDGEPKNPES